MTQTIKYTDGQEKGAVIFGQFYMSAYENVLVLKGFSGTGKSTLVQRLITELPKLNAMLETLMPDYRPYEPKLTATTNQAAEALAASTGFGEEVTTIHKFLGLRLETTCYIKQSKELRPTLKERRERFLIFIDECSYIDQKLMKLILSETVDCKIIFIGDHAQLKPVGSSYMPAFEMNRNEINLTQMVRFDDGPIYNMVSALRKTVLEGVWPNFSDFLSPGVIEKVDRPTFMHMAEQAFKPDSGMGRVKMLAYANDQVISYNNWLSQAFSGSPDPQEGQIMVNNEECNNGSARIPNNSEVQLASVQVANKYGYPGWMVRLSNKPGQFFMPANFRETKKKAHAEAVRKDDYAMMQEVVDAWIDLRPAYSCTVNKSQGSTYDTSFIDLGNIIRWARGGDALARALYVGCSRAKSRMLFTGDVGG